MSVNLYQTGVSGLNAAQQQLATTSHNISNVNTEGYNRQRAEQINGLGNPLGGNFIGSGTFINDITRLYDQFSYKEQLLSQSNLGGANSSYASLNKLNDIMSYSGQALLGDIDRFYQAMNGIADNPSDLGLRDVALTQAGILASDFNSLNENFDQLEKSTNGEIEQVARQISEISVEIAKINESVLQNGSAGVTGQPNDLLDKRDILVSALGEFTKVNTITDQNGVMTVMIGSGSTLVAGITPLQVAISAGDPDPNQTKLSLMGVNGSVAIDKETIGGSLGAQLKFRDDDLMALRSEVNRLAMGISETLNSAQRQGLDLNQGQGQDIFTDINSPTSASGRILSHSDNTSGLSAQIIITDVGLVPTDEFEIEFDGTNYVMTNQTDGSVQTLGAPGATNYATNYGFDFVELANLPTAPANTGDKWTVRPSENSASLMKVVMNDGATIAASQAVEIQTSDNNVGAGKVEITHVTDPVVARALMPMKIEAIEDPIGAPGVYSYEVFDNAGNSIGTGSYTPPGPPASAVFDIASGVPPTIVASGTGDLSIEISGTPTGSFPASPEQFVIADAFGIGNGNNAVAMALTQEQGIFNNGRDSFSQSLGSATATVGSKTKSAELVADTADAMFNQAYNRNQAISGVNLDEEAANLIRFQQAYQASSQIISTANTLFDTLLSVAR